ncbi:hypothetical protein IT774_02820 [Salinimonas marina]|uniref:DUF6314 domain-containing protein n=1 Tax=Salinimonas marina TaxID=2785918 RepID=A0A7S9DYH5_9ALTE|nr:DUF6314 family protein [Salinimonas marina]QPG06167.1 hypothetical protein IT774_02820 [Salinimonas marina]
MPGLKDFAGAWRLNRTIVQRNGETFVFEGAANFTWHEQRLKYKEVGLVMAPNGKKLPAERTYFWQAGSGGQIDVLFDDNRYFHSFSSLVPHAEHLCGKDDYKVDYVFRRWPIWESEWQVTGPRKDYAMRSRYEPD